MAVDYDSEMHSQALEGRRRWAEDAVTVVEQVLMRARPGQIDGLLDLRAALKEGADWTRVMDLFLVCRRVMEHDHYLPFYRLRRLLAHWLALELRSERDPKVRADLRRLLRWKFRSLADLTAALERERFEGHQGKADAGQWVLSERTQPV
jgi:hypothetical protein